MSEIEKNFDMLMSRNSDGTASETFLLQPYLVVIGVKSGSKQIVQNENGIYVEQDKIVPQVLFDSRKRNHSPYFIVDIETGNRAEPSWYLGCKTLGRVTSAKIYEEPDETSSVVCQVDNASVQINTPIDNAGTYYWYDVKYGEKSGYMKATSISEIIYSD